MSQFTNPIFELPYNYKIGIVVCISILIMYYGYNKWIEYNNKKNSKETKVSSSSSDSSSIIGSGKSPNYAVSPSPLPKGIGDRFNKLKV